MSRAGRGGSVADGVPGERPPPAPRRLVRLRIWRGVATLIIVAGALASWLAARVVAEDAASDARANFGEESSNIAASATVTLQREQDLLVGARGVIAQNQSASDAGFARWAELVQALARHPEIAGIGHAALVSRADLPETLARLHRDAAPGTVVTAPRGNRPYSCLITTAVWRAPAVPVPLGADLCATEPISAALATRDSGRDGYQPIRIGTRTMLLVTSPVYRTGGTPASVEQRRAAFVGWAGMAISPQQIFRWALAGHQNYAVTLQYGAGADHATFASGVGSPGGFRSMRRLEGGLTMEITAPPVTAGIAGHSVAVAVLAGGLLLSLTIGLLIYLLATKRVRALRLLAEKADELRRQALHDPLTGLPNRMLVLDRAEQLLARTRRNGGVPVALYFDLDEFKSINDTGGHRAGDYLLHAVAARLSESLRDIDTVGRMGGDEFVILLEISADNAGPELVAQRLLDRLREPFEVPQIGPVAVTACIGIAVGHRDQPEELLRDADIALAQAKAAGRDCSVIFHAEMGSHLRHRHELELELRAALARGEFHLVYQPIFDLHNVAITGVEALLRWKHPTLGTVRPDEFIPLLENSGRIVEVGRWVLQEACRQAAVWRASGRDLTMAVNLSGRQLDRDDILDHVREALAANRLEPEALTVEITETALMVNVDATARRLAELKLLGVNVAVDDFGTGYSSLAYLQRLPVDYMKIDRSFTEAITSSAEAAALVHTLVRLGRDLGLQIIAEGVETTAQMERLRDEDVDEVQGFLLARPLEAEGVTAMLRRTPRRRPREGALR